MASFEDLHPEQIPTEACFRNDMGRFAENVHRLIAVWRAMAQAGQDPRPVMADATTGLLGRLRRAYEFLQANAGELNGLSTRIGMTTTEITNKLIEWRDMLRTFRDAAKNNQAQTKAAVDALSDAFPRPKDPPAVSPFLNAELPQGW